MRKFIDAITEAASHPSTMVRQVLDQYITEWGGTPATVNDGGCFEFADEVERAFPDFQAMSLGEIFVYQVGERGIIQHEVGFDEKLLSQHWPAYQPLHGFTWKEMFDNGFGWNGIHAWAHHLPTGLCFDAETLEGVRNPFELGYFKPRWNHMLKLRNEGKLRIA